MIIVFFPPDAGQKVVSFQTAMSCMPGAGHVFGAEGNGRGVAGSNSDFAAAGVLGLQEGACGTAAAAVDGVQLNVIPGRVYEPEGGRRGREASRLT